MILYKQKVPSSWQSFLFRQTFFNATFVNTFAFSFEFPVLECIIQYTYANIYYTNRFNLETREGVTHIRCVHVLFQLGLYLATTAYNLSYSNISVSKVLEYY